MLVVPRPTHSQIPPELRANRNNPELHEKSGFRQVRGTGKLNMVKTPFCGNYLPKLPMVGHHNPPVR
jgi:hypothetical protein